MTRGRHANTAYVTTDQPETEAHNQPHPGATPDSVLAGVMSHVGAEQSGRLRDLDDRPLGLVLLCPVLLCLVLLVLGPRGARTSD